MVMKIFFEGVLNSSLPYLIRSNSDV
jgi:hypothetical protein